MTKILDICRSDNTRWYATYTARRCFRHKNFEVRQREFVVSTSTLILNCAKWNFQANVTWTRSFRVSATNTYLQKLLIINISLWTHLCSFTCSFAQLVSLISYTYSALMLTLTTMSKDPFSKKSAVFIYKSAKVSPVYYYYEGEGYMCHMRNL